jgi:hypothetical protein
MVCMNLWPLGGVEALKEHNERVSYDKPTLLDRKTKELVRVAVQSTPYAYGAQAWSVA